MADWEKLIHPDAERLKIKPTTVVAHCRDLMRKLKLHSVAELTRYAVEHRLSSAT